MFKHTHLLHFDFATNPGPLVKYPHLSGMSPHSRIIFELHARKRLPLINKRYKSKLGILGPVDESLRSGHDEGRATALRRCSLVTSQVQPTRIPPIYERAADAGGARCLCHQPLFPTTMPSRAAAAATTCTGATSIGTLIVQGNGVRKTKQKLLVVHEDIVRGNGVPKTKQKRVWQPAQDQGFGQPTAADREGHLGRYSTL